MAQYDAEIRWQRDAAEAFTDRRYGRGHTWQFDGGITVAASSSPHSVPLPFSRTDAVDPEEAFVASIASCHMLTFLFLAAKAGFVVDAYVDSASGYMEKNARGKLAVTRAVLRPAITFSGAKVPTEADLAQLHHASHEECYIASSVTTDITVEGSWRHTGV